jgi:beta-lactamase regulating signal transducer with metallopeptidase domain
MRPWLALDPVWSPEVLLLLYNTALRATLLLVLFALAARLLRRSSASVLSALWAVSLLALIPLPTLRAMPLYWSAHVVPSLLAAPIIAIGRTMVAQSSPDAAAIPWTSVVGFVWLAGAAFVVARLVYEQTTLARVAGGATPVRDQAWLTLLAEARAELGIRRAVVLLRAGALRTPLTWGTLHPAVVLPSDVDSWPEPDRRAVLLHELAHVRRLDCLLALLAHGACAFWWFHPGAWWASRRLYAERERACDARVLRAGVRPSDYAECLLRIADGARSETLPTPRLAARLYQSSHLAARLHDVLDPRGTSRGERSRRSALPMLAASIAMLLIVGAMRLGPSPSVLWSALESPSWATRAYGAEGIARSGDPGSLERLARVVARDANPRVRVHARYGALLRERGTAPLVRFGWPRGAAAVVVARAPIVLIAPH